MGVNYRRIIKLPNTAVIYFRKLPQEGLKLPLCDNDIVSQSSSKSSELKLHLK
jgi:hypothetical protein